MLVRLLTDAEVSLRHVSTAADGLRVGATVATHLRLAGQWEQQEGATGGGQGEPTLFCAAPFWDCDATGCGLRTFLSVLCRSIWN